MHTPVDLDTYPEDEPGFDLDDAAIIACIVLIIAGSLGVVGIAIRIAVGG